RQWELAVLYLAVPSSRSLSTLSLHDALPISQPPAIDGMVGIALDLDRAAFPHAHVQTAAGGTFAARGGVVGGHAGDLVLDGHQVDRKSTRLNSSHGSISYAVFCLKKKTKATK